MNSILNCGYAVSSNAISRTAQPPCLCRKDVRDAPAGRQPLIASARPSDATSHIKISRESQ